MITKHCQLCGYGDDVDYLHPLYDGRGDRFVLICEKCRESIFSDKKEAP